MGLRIGMRVTAGNKRDAGLAVIHAGIVPVAWDGGGISHRPIATLTALGKDASMRLIGYIRVSTNDQAASGLGLDAQETGIRREIKRREWSIVRIE